LNHQAPGAEIRNPKPETRNKPKRPKREQIQNPRAYGLFRAFGLWISGLFRVSGFGFRFSIPFRSAALFDTPGRLPAPVNPCRR
jgi:hypothetical protein